MREVYHLVFYNYYCFSRFVGKNTYSHFFRDPSWAGVILLSAMMLFNVIAVGIWLRVPYLTTSYNLDVALTGIIIWALNAIYFIGNKRYLKIVDEYDKSTSPRLFDFQMITVVYSILSCLLFYWIHSQK